MNRITAGLVAGGTFLCVVATPLLLASAYAGAVEFIKALMALGQTYPEPSRTSINEVLAWSGWICLGVGAAALAVGLYRLLAARASTTSAAGPPSSEALDSAPV